MKRSGIVMAGLLIGSFLVGHPAAAINNGPLDGKVFKSEVGVEGKTAGQKDDLIFKEGNFRSAACDPFGFKEVQYQTAQAGDITTFEAKAVNANGETMLWRGNVKGKHVEGKATWARAGQEPVEHWFKGDAQE